MENLWRTYLTSGLYLFFFLVFVSAQEHNGGMERREQDLNQRVIVEGSLQRIKTREDALKIFIFFSIICGKITVGRTLFRPGHITVRR